MTNSASFWSMGAWERGHNRLSLVPRLSQNANIYYRLHNFNVRVPERGSLGTRLHVSPAQLQCSRSGAWEPGNEAIVSGPDRPFGNGLVVQNNLGHELSTSHMDGAFIP